MLEICLAISRRTGITTSCHVSTFQLVTLGSKEVIERGSGEWWKEDAMIRGREEVIEGSGEEDAGMRERGEREDANRESMVRAGEARKVEGMDLDRLRRGGLMEGGINDW